MPGGGHARLRKRVSERERNEERKNEPARSTVVGWRSWARTMKPVSRVVLALMMASNSSRTTWAGATPAVTRQSSVS